MQMDAELKRAFLYGIAAALAVSAALAMAAVLLEGLNPLWRHVQASALVLGAGSILGLLFVELRARGVADPLGCVGVLVTAAAVVLNLVAIWTDAGVEEFWGKAMASVSFSAMALAAVGLMALAELPEPWHQRVRAATSAAIALYMLLLWWLLWTRDASDWLRKGLQIMTILSVLGAATVFILYVVGRLSEHKGE